MSVLTRLLGRPRGQSEIEKQQHNQLARDRGQDRCYCDQCGGPKKPPEQIPPSAAQIRRATKGIACSKGKSGKCWCAICTEEFNSYTQSLELDHMRGRHG